MTAISHYGVPGMKWGVRRSEAQLDAAAKRRSDRQAKRSKKKAKASKYTKSQKQIDVATMGQKAANKIQNASDKGKSVNAARVRQGAKQAAVAGAATTATAVAALGLMVMSDPAMLSSMDAKLSDIASNKRANDKAKAGAKAAADVMAENGLTNYSTIVADSSDYEWS